MSTKTEQHVKEVAITLVKARGKPVVQLLLPPVFQRDERAVARRSWSTKVLSFASVATAWMLITCSGTSGGSPTTRALEEAVRDLGGDQFEANRPPSDRGILGLECSGGLTGSPILVATDAVESKSFESYSIKYNGGYELLADFEGIVSGDGLRVGGTAGGGSGAGLTVVLEGIKVKYVSDSPTPALSSPAFSLTLEELKGPGLEFTAVRAQISASKIKFVSSELARAGLRLALSSTINAKVDVGATTDEQRVVTAGGDGLVLGKGCGRLRVKFEEGVHLSGRVANWGIYSLRVEESPSGAFVQSSIVTDSSLNKSFSDVKVGTRLVIDTRNGSTVFATITKREETREGLQYEWDLARYSARWIPGG